MKNNKKELKFIPIGGTASAQKNHYIYETDNEILVIDCGVGFGDDETPGIDITIPDFRYVLENREKVKGILITHGHYDHRSSLKYLLKQHKFKVYAVPFVRDLIEMDLSEYKELKDFKVNTFDPDKPFKIGSFDINAYRMNHSIPDTMGFAIDTPVGRIIHNTDFKFDFTPVMDEPFDVQKLAKLSWEKTPLILLSDCLGSLKEGYSNSEKYIESTYDELFSKHYNSQIFITTTSSNVSRWQMAINAAERHKRKIATIGRSVDQSIDVARKIGYITSRKDTFVSDKQAANMPQNQVIYFISGAYADKRSAMSRLSENRHNLLKIQPNNSVVIFSADPMPSAIASVDRVINNFYRMGAEVYFSEIQGGLHVSGHGGKGDQALLANLVKPEYYIPIGGEAKFREAYKELIMEQGVEEKKILSLQEGQPVIFNSNGYRFGKKMKIKEIYIEGETVGAVTEQILDERKVMADNGVVFIVKGENDTISVTTRGFMNSEYNKEMLGKIKAQVEKAEKTSDNTKRSKNKYIENKIRNFLYKQIRYEPLVIAKNFK